MRGANSCPRRSSRRTKRTLWLSHPSDRATLVKKGILPARPSSSAEKLCGLREQRELFEGEETISMPSHVVDPLAAHMTDAKDSALKNGTEKEARLERSSPITRMNEFPFFSPSLATFSSPKGATRNKSANHLRNAGHLPNEPLFSLHQAKQVVNVLTSLFPIPPSKDNCTSMACKDPQCVNPNASSFSSPEYEVVRKTTGDGIVWLDFVHPTSAEVSTVLSWLAPSLPHLMVATRHWISLHKEEENNKCCLPQGENKESCFGGCDTFSPLSDSEHTERGTKAELVTPPPSSSSDSTSHSSFLPRYCSADYYWSRGSDLDMNHVVFYPSYGYGLLRFTALRATKKDESIQARSKDTEQKETHQQTPQESQTATRVWFAPTISPQLTSLASSSYEEDVEVSTPSADPFIVVSCVLLDRAMITFRNGYFKDEDEVISELQWCFEHYYSSMNPSSAPRCTSGEPFSNEGDAVHVASGLARSSLSPCSPPGHSNGSLSPVLTDHSHHCSSRSFPLTTPFSRLSPTPPEAPSSQPASLTNTDSVAAFSSSATISNLVEKTAMHRDHYFCNASSDPNLASSPFSLPISPHQHLIPLLVSTMIEAVVDELKHATIPLLIETNRVDELALTMRPSPEDQEDLLRRMRNIRHQIHQWHIQLLRKEALLQQLLATTQKGKRSSASTSEFLKETRKGMNVLLTNKDSSSRLRCSSYRLSSTRKTEGEKTTPTKITSSERLFFHAEGKKNTNQKVRRRTAKPAAAVDDERTVFPEVTRKERLRLSVRESALDSSHENLPDAPAEAIQRSSLPFVISLSDSLSTTPISKQRAQCVKMKRKPYMNIQTEEKNDIRLQNVLKKPDFCHDGDDVNEKEGDAGCFSQTILAQPTLQYPILEGEVVARYLHALTSTKLAIESIRRARDTINFSSMSVVSGVVAQLGELGHLTDYWNTLQAVIALLVMPVNIIPGIMSCNFTVPFENSTSKSIFWIIVAITLGLLLIGLAHPIYQYYRYKLPGSIAPL